MFSVLTIYFLQKLLNRFLCNFFFRSCTFLAQFFRLFRSFSFSFEWEETVSDIRQSFSLNSLWSYSIFSVCSVFLSVLRSFHFLLDFFFRFSFRLPLSFPLCLFYVEGELNPNLVKSSLPTKSQQKRLDTSRTTTYQPHINVGILFFVEAQAQSSVIKSSTRV